MKKMNQLFLLACFLLGSSILFSCRDDSFSNEMPAPSDIEFYAKGSTMSVSWSPVTGASSYLYEFREIGGEVISGEVSEPFLKKDGLNPDGEYEIRLQAVNSSTMQKSAWSDWESSTMKMYSNKFASGAGTEVDPYIIETPGQLARLSHVVNTEMEGYSEYGVYYELKADINLKKYKNWEPIGIGTGSHCIGMASPVVKKAFRGHFKGNNFTVSNLTVDMTTNDAEAYAGLFGLNEGWIEGVNVQGTVKAKSNYTGSGYLTVGGVVGLSKIAYDSNNDILPITGGIVSNSFKGNVSADSGTDANGIAVAGGICGFALSGNIDGSTVNIESGNSIHSISGTNPAAGGVVAVQMAGRLSGATVNIAGNVLSEFLSNTANHEDASVTAGGVLGYCGRLQGATQGAAGVENCNINISGTVKAVAAGDYCTSTVGALAGVSNFDIAVSCHSEISGSLLGQGEDTVYTGGLVGAMILGYGGANQMFNCTVNITSTGDVSGKQTNETVESLSSSVNVGGMVGGLSSQASSTLVRCDVTSEGKITAYNASTGNHAVMCGGIMGSSATTAGCSFVMKQNAVMDVSGKLIYAGGVAGGYRGTPSKKYVGNYAIIDGKIKTHYASGNYEAYVGGVTGFTNGTGVGPSAQKARMYGCYSVFRGTIESEGSAALTKGAISGRIGTSILSTNYWWSTFSGMLAVGSDTPDNPMSGTVKFSSIDEAGFNEAKDAMNPVLIENDLNTQYVYDPSKGYLVY